MPCPTCGCLGHPPSLATAAASYTDGLNVTLRTAGPRAPLPCGPGCQSGSTGSVGLEIHTTGCSAAPIVSWPEAN